MYLARSTATTTLQVRRCDERVNVLAPFAHRHVHRPYDHPAVLRCVPLGGIAPIDGRSERAASTSGFVRSEADASHLAAASEQLFLHPLARQNELNAFGLRPLFRSAP